MPAGHAPGAHIPTHRDRAMTEQVPHCVRRYTSLDQARGKVTAQVVPEPARFGGHRTVSVREAVMAKSKTPKPRLPRNCSRSGLFDPLRNQPDRSHRPDDVHEYPMLPEAQIREVFRKIGEVVADSGFHVLAQVSI